MRRFFITILILGGLGVGGYFAFMEFAPKKTKEKVLDTVGIKPDSPIRDHTMETFIEGSKIAGHKNLVGKWVINGWLRNSHDSKPVSQIKLRFDFSDGKEYRVLKEKLNPSGLGKPFMMKISGHRDATFEGWEIIRAY
ncbi:MAG: hypothetical protein AAF570_22625 [Bacteroidota bacterium]